MKRLICLLLVAVSLTGCGGGGGAAVGGGDTGDGTEVPWPSYSVATAADLPTCPASNITGRIYYVEDESVMKACKSTGWSTINTGTYIVSNKKIAAGGVDLCTEISGESCYFMGGQIVKYSDGSILITGLFTWLFIIVGDSDTDTLNNSFLMTPTGAGATITMSTYVARGAGYKTLWLVYSRAADTVTLVHDTSGDGSLGGGDTTLATLTVSDW